MRDAERFVRAALESVLHEKEVPLEVIVIDDGSSDSSAEIVSSLGDPRIRMIAGPQEGIAAALNAGLEQAQGEIIMRCDADDCYAPGRIARQSAWLRSHPEFGALCGSFATMDERGRVLSRLNTGTEDMEITDELRSGQTRTHLCTFAMRAQLVRDLGGCRPYFVTGEDIDLQLRLGEVTRIWYEATPVYEYRLHGASATHTQADSRRLFFDRVAREFAMQRRETGIDDLQRGTPPPPPLAEGRAQSSATHKQGMLIGEAWRQHRSGRKWKAIRTGWRACWVRPADWRTWKSLLALTIKR